MLDLKKFRADMREEADARQGEPFPPLPCAHLPLAPRMELVEASQTSTVGDPLARVRAVNKASENVRAKYPEFFRVRGS